MNHTFPREIGKEEFAVLTQSNTALYGDNDTEWMEYCTIASLPTPAKVEWRELEVPGIGYCWIVSINQQGDLIRAEVFKDHDEAKARFIPWVTQYWHH